MNFIKDNILHLRQHSFIKNVATLQMGSFTGSIIQAGIGIVIARLLQPELFGVYSLAIGLASMTSLVLGMGIQEATMAGVFSFLGINFGVAVLAAIIFRLIYYVIPFFLGLALSKKWNGEDL